MESLTKQREILFRPALTDGELRDRSALGRESNIEHDQTSDLVRDLIQDQAKAAIFLLADVDGILDLKYLSKSNVLVTYDIRILTLDTIHQALSSVGFKLDCSLISKIKNALYAYTEDTLRENLGIIDSKLTRDIFVQGYKQRSHGCRDQRSQYWRRYL